MHTQGVEPFGDDIVDFPDEWFAIMREGPQEDTIGAIGNPKA